MSDTSGELLSSDEAANDCSLAPPDGDSVNLTDASKATQLQALRKTSVDPKQESIEQDMLISETSFHAFWTVTQTRIIVQNSKNK